MKSVSARQAFNLFFFFAYWIGPVILYFITSVTASTSYLPIIYFTFYMFWCVILYFGLLTYEYNRLPIFHPILPKPIYHSTSTYWLSFDGTKYVWYQDKIFYLEKIAQEHKNTITSAEVLKNYSNAHIKSAEQKKAEIFAKKEEKRKKKGYLDQWDGFLSHADRRDNKLKNILK